MSPTSLRRGSASLCCRPFSILRRASTTSYSSASLLDSCSPTGIPRIENTPFSNTLYVFAQYFCWIEILRREAQFIDPRNDDRSAKVVHAIEAVRDIFTDSLTIEEPCFRLFRGEQRALGEVMLVPVNDPPAGAPRWECMGYAPFVQALEDPQTARWFRRLREDIDVLAADVAGHDTRLRLIQGRLMDIIDIVDPDERRVPARLRHRLDTTSLPARTLIRQSTSRSARDAG